MKVRPLREEHIRPMRACYHALGTSTGKGLLAGVSFGVVLVLESWLMVDVGGGPVLRVRVWLRLTPPMLLPLVRFALAKALNWSTREPPPSPPGGAGPVVC